jgi:hypothetical protein
MTDQDQTPNEEQQAELGNIAGSILSAFNLGVSFNQQTGATKTTVEVTEELGHTIYTNLSQVYGERFQDEFLRANTEYFLQIALLGYIIPSVCAYEEDFKNRLLSLIEQRAVKSQEQQTSGGGSGGGGGSIITP